MLELYQLTLSIWPVSTHICPAILMPRNIFVWNTLCPNFQNPFKPNKTHMNLPQLLMGEGGVSIFHNWQRRWNKVIFEILIWHAKWVLVAFLTAAVGVSSPPRKQSLWIMAKCGSLDVILGHPCGGYGRSPCWSSQSSCNRRWVRPATKRKLGRGNVTADFKGCAWFLRCRERWGVI